MKNPGIPSIAVSPIVHQCRTIPIPNAEHNPSNIPPTNIFTPILIISLTGNNNIFKIIKTAIAVNIKPIISILHYNPFIVYYILNTPQLQQIKHRILTKNLILKTKKDI